VVRESLLSGTECRWVCVIILFCLLLQASLCPCAAVAKSSEAGTIRGMKIVSAGGGNGNISHPEYSIDGDPKTAVSFELPNAVAWIVVDLGDAYAIDAVRITNGQKNMVIWLNEVSVSPDREHFRPLLGRRVNLPTWRGGDTEVVSLSPSVARYVKVAFCGGGPQGEIGEVAFDGHKNYPERHLMCWAGNIQTDYLVKLDYLANDLGATDLWLDYIETAFPQTNNNSGFETWEKSGALRAFKKRGMRYWLSEHEAFTTMVGTPEALRDDLAWETTLRQMRSIYAKAHSLGFRGLVYDAEDYVSVPDEVKKKYADFADWVTPFSFFEEFGYGGYYYQRGLQVGRAIKESHLDTLIQVYEARMYAGKPGCRDGNYWWLKGIHDAGVEIWIATEKTYGAGNREIPQIESPEHLHYWFVRLPQFMIDAHSAYPFAARIFPGFHPWNTRTHAPNYLPNYFDQQLGQAQDCTEAYWIYTEGTGSGGDPRDVLNRDICGKYGVTPEQYLEVLGNHSTSRSVK
jgi:hypothetical protein